jgi:hypothetical protein
MPIRIVHKIKARKEFAEFGGNWVSLLFPL